MTEKRGGLDSSITDIDAAKKLAEANINSLKAIFTNNGMSSIEINIEYSHANIPAPTGDLASYDIRAGSASDLQRDTSALGAVSKGGPGIIPVLLTNVSLGGLSDGFTPGNGVNGFFINLGLGQGNTSLFAHETGHVAHYTGTGSLEPNPDFDHPTTDGFHSADKKNVMYYKSYGNTKVDDEWIDIVSKLGVPIPHP